MAERSRRRRGLSVAGMVWITVVCVVLLFVLLPTFARFRGSRGPAGIGHSVIGTVEVTGDYDDSVQLALKVVETHPSGREVVLHSQALTPEPCVTWDGREVMATAYMAGVDVDVLVPRGSRLDYAIGKALMGGLRKRMLWHPERYTVRVTSSTHDIDCKPPSHRTSPREGNWDFAVTVK